MDDLISRAAAIEAVQTDGGCGICIQRLVDLPTIDVGPMDDISLDEFKEHLKESKVVIFHPDDYVSVVRCKDCKYFKPDEKRPELNIGFCELHDDGDYGFVSEPDWFCASGERRESE